MLDKFQPYLKDIFSGITLSLLSAPIAISMGLIIYANLNPNYANFAALVGLLTIAITSLCNFILPYSYKVVSISDPVLAVFCNQVLLSFVVLFQDPLSLPFTFLAFILMLLLLSAMLFQALFVYLNVHVLIRYISLPVSVALISSLGIIVCKIAFEFITTISFFNVLYMWESIDLIYLFIGIICFVISWNNWSFGFPVSSFLVSIIFGSGLFYIFFLVGWVQYSTFSFESNLFIQFFDLGHTFQLLFTENFFRKIQIILTGGFILAIFNILYNMIIFVSINQIVSDSIPAKKYLFLDTILNGVTAFFGGVLSPLSVLSTGILIELKVRNKVVILTQGILCLFLFFFFPKICMYIPKCVLGGLLFVFGIKLIHPWIFSTTRKVFSFDHSFNLRLLFNLIICICVISIVLLFNFIYGLIVGIILSQILFLISISKKKMFYESNWHSKISSNVRSKYAEDLLVKHKNKILILTLKGDLFFSVITVLVNRLELCLTNDETYIVLDFNLVSEIDLTSEKIILKIFKRLLFVNKTIYCFGFSDALSGFKDELLSMDGIFFCRSLLESMQSCENHLLFNLYSLNEKDIEFSLVDIFSHYGLSVTNVSNLITYMTPLKLEKNQILLKENHPNSSLFFLLHGNLEVSYFSVEKNQSQFIANVFSGTIIGEMSFLSENVKASASVKTLSDCYLLELSYSNFIKLKEKDSDLSLLIMKLIGLILRIRLIRSQQM